MSTHHDVPADIEPDAIGDLIADAQWLVVAAPPVRIRPGAFTAMAGSTIDITDACVSATEGFGD